MFHRYQHLVANMSIFGLQSLDEFSGTFQQQSQQVGSKCMHPRPESY